MTPNNVRLRQQHLLVRSTELRLASRGHLQSLERPAALADHLKAGWVWLCQHPQWPALGLVLLLMLKPGRVAVWAGRLWWLWRSTRTLRRMRDAVLQNLSRILPP